MRRKKYVLAYLVCFIAITFIYFALRVDAENTTNVLVATKDLPPGAIIEPGDVEYRSTSIVEGDRGRVWITNSVDELVGKQIAGFGIRKGRPLLQQDVVESDGQLYELKLVGDMTIPEEAKVVDITIVFDQRNFPDHAPKVIATNVPVKQVYNNQNMPIDMTDIRMNKVPRAISVYVTAEQKENILKHQNQGVFVFSTIP